MFEETKTPVEKRLKTFNKKFKEVKHVQTVLKLASSTLAKKMRTMNAEMIMPKYEVLLNEFNSEGSKGKSVRYTVEKLSDTLNSFFTKV